MNVPLVVQSRCLKSFSVWILSFLRFEVRLLKRLAKAKLLLTQAWQEASRKQLQLLRFSGPMNGLKPMETDLFRNGSMIMQGFLMIS